MGWVPGFLAADEEERRRSPDGLSPLDITYGDFGGGGGGDDGKWPKGPIGWILFVLLLAAEVVGILFIVGVL